MDLVLMVAALAAAIIVLFSPDTQLSVTDYAQDFVLTRIKVSNAVLCAVLLTTWHFCFKFYGLYESYRLRHVDDTVMDVAKGVAACSVTLLVMAQLGGWKTITLVTVLVFFVFAVAMVGGLRMTVYRMSQLFRRRGINTKSLLVIGGGPRAQEFMKRISGRRELGYNIIGFLDSSPLFNTSQAASSPWLGGFEELAKIIDTQVVDEVAIALPIKSQYAQIKLMIDRLAEQGIAVHLLSDFFPHDLAKVRPTEFQGLSLLSLTSTAPFCWRTEVKRLIDVVIAAIMLIVGSPIFILSAIAIKLDSKGPIFFSQSRMGYNKRRFNMIKFRTMVPDAEAKIEDLLHLNEKDGPIFKITKDPRITRVGRFLRKFSIDELPQLFNVLLGDMSLVGPRPLSIREAVNLEQSWHKRRFSVKPGMTCLWQISGRSNLSFEEWVELDLEYIDTWSLQLDWLILAKTLPAVIAARGAS